MLGLLFLFLVVSRTKGLTEQSNYEDNGIAIKRGRYHVPSFMLIGTVKGGTTNLDDMIRLHPLVGETKHDTKELRFFTRNVGSFIERKEESSIAKAYQEMVIGSLEKNVIPAEKHAALAFLNKTHHIAEMDPNFDPSERVFLPVVTFDATPTYLYEQDVPDNIKGALPWLSKFVISLRNPVDRAYSHHRMDKRLKEWNYTFEEDLNLELKIMIEAGLVPRDVELFDTTEGVASKESLSFTSSFRMPDDFYGSGEELAAWERYSEIHRRSRITNSRIMTRGMYAVQIRNWLRHYSLESFLFLKLEDALNSSDGTQARADAVFEFLGLPSYNTHSGKKGITSQNFWNARHEGTEPMKATTRLRLEQLFEPYNKQLASLLGPKWENPW